MQFTFGMLEDEERRKKATMLDEVSQIVDFRRIEKLLLKIYKHGDRPPIPPLMLFKALLDVGVRAGGEYEARCCPFSRLIRERCVREQWKVDKTPQAGRDKRGKFP